jgi:hypothetical protein
MLRRWFAPSVFLASDTVEAAARAYEQAADGDDATVRYNADTARTAATTGGRSYTLKNIPVVCQNVLSQDVGSIPTACVSRPSMSTSI